MSFLPYIIDALCYIGIFAILSLSLNIEVGFTKLVNFGKVAFFAIGAYTSALLTLNGVSFPIAFITSVMLASFAGYVIAIPTLRLREDYFAIVTIAFGEILRLFFANEVWLTNGTNGLRGIPRPFSELISQNYQAFYLLLIGITLTTCYFVSDRVEKSPFGRVLRAIRDDDVAAEALGKDVYMFRTKALIIGSGMAGASGSLFAHYITFIAPDMFTPLVTFSIWIMIVIGGTANNMGALLGAALIQSFERGTRFIKDFVTIPLEPADIRMIIIGLLLIIFIIYNPEGILKEKKVKIYIPKGLESGKRNA
jgi:branched-chain amino acid transport system permease protein